MELWSLTALESAAALREGRATPRELVDACVARLGAVGGEGFGATRFQAARAEADQAARRRSAGEDGPLLGVPCAVIGSLSVRGMPQAGAGPGVVADRDATVIRRLRRAGAVVLGLARSEAALAALVAVGGVPFGLAGDEGGSLRLAAASRGVVAHRPTGGSVPTTGSFPHPPRGTGAMAVIGPVARSVADLEPLLGVICGPDGLDRSTDRAFAPARVALDRVRVALPGRGNLRADTEVAAAVHTAGATLRERGARLVPWEGPPPGRGLEWRAALLAASGDPRVRWARTLLAVERLAGRVPGRGELVREASAAADALDAALGEDGVLLHPVSRRPAPRWPHRAWDPRDAAATALFEVTRSPVTTVPVAVGRRGRPVSVQVVAARGRDALALAVAGALEAAHGTPSVVEPRGQSIGLVRRRGLGSAR